MVEKVVIRDSSNAPLNYISKLSAFSKGKVYQFKEGVNIIVGENGSGKSSLLNLIKTYLCVDNDECSMGVYNSCIDKLKNPIENEFRGGVDVYADYTRNTFRLCHQGERSSDDSLSSFDNFTELFVQKHSSTGEGVLIALDSLFKRMFNEKAKLTFDYSQFDNDRYREYYNYIQDHKIEGNEYTILMDEPDRNLDLTNIQSIKAILSYHKPQTQIIAVIHNPLLIYSLSKNESINFIELSKGYISKVKKAVEDLLK